MTWDQIFEKWSLVECDLADIGIDLGDDALMESRSWRWLETKIRGLLDKPVISYVEVAHPTDKTKVVIQPIYPTRLRAHFAPGA